MWAAAAATCTARRCSSSAPRTGIAIALVYGRDSEWVKNALAHGAVRLISRRRAHELTEPEVVIDPHRQHVPAFERTILRFMRVSEFIDFHSAR